MTSMKKWNIRDYDIKIEINSQWEENKNVLINYRILSLKNKER